MVQIVGGHRTSFDNKVTKFCINNNLSIGYKRPMGNYIATTVSGETEDIDKYLTYINELEEERKKKNWWYKLFN